MSSLRGALLALSVSVSLACTTVVPAAAAVPGGAVASAPAPGWKLAYRADRADSFTEVQTVDARTAWALGSGFVDGANEHLVMRWDGTSWNRLATPPLPGDSLPTAYPSLHQLAAYSATDLWLFGSYRPRPPRDEYAQFALHWDGHTWRTFELGQGTYVSDAVAVGPGQVRAVGHQIAGSVEKPIALDFDGHVWRTASTPVFGVRLSASSATDIWATTRAEDRKPRIMHWDGREWRVVATPPVQLTEGSVSYDFTDVLATGAKDAWVSVGFSQREGLGIGVVLLRWDGQRWLEAPGRALDDASSLLAASGRNSVWVVSAGLRREEDLLRYHNGGFVRQPAPSGPDRDTQFRGVQRIPGTRSLWAVGLESTAGQDENHGVIYRYDY